MARGIALSVRDHPGGDPAILALHGLASNARWWDLVARELGGAQRLLAVDQRGHGLSDRPSTGYDFDSIVADVDTVAGQVHPEPLIVAGHSWGAWVAIAYGAAHPERTLGVVCVDGGVGDLASHFGGSWEVAEAAMRPPDLTGVTEDAVVGWLSGDGLAGDTDSAEVAPILLANFEPIPGQPDALRPRLRLENHMQIAKALYEFDTAAALRRMRCPVLLLPARQGAIPLEEKESALRAAVELAGGPASIEWIDGGHDLPVQRPAEVAEAIARFSRLCGAPSNRGG
jgi:pimeloyl-ACP methyl ester carboxylesterase